MPHENVRELLATVLARPLFNPSRRPSDKADTGTGAAGLGDSRLTGIVTEPKRRIAIFVVTGGKPLIVGEGENVNGWRIDSITPQEVSLSGPDGTKTLTPKSDPSLVVPSVPMVRSIVGQPAPMRVVPVQMRPPGLPTVPPQMRPTPFQGRPGVPVIPPRPYKSE